jgi:hypothetical protein
MTQDFAAAWRFLWTSPGSTATAILTLAVAAAIGDLELRRSRATVIEGEQPHTAVEG